MGEQHDPLEHVGAIEMRLLGPLIRRMLRSGSPAVERALQRTGPKATARMACVNATRLCALLLFVLGAVVQLAGALLLSYVLLGLAGAFMAWSLWCLYTVAGPEREFKRARRT